MNTAKLAIAVVAVVIGTVVCRLIAPSLEERYEATSKRLILRLGFTIIRKFIYFTTIFANKIIESLTGEDPIYGPLDEGLVSSE